MTDQLLLVGIGHDVALEDLLPIDPQPATPGMLFTRRQNAISGKVTDEGAYILYHFDLLEDDEQLQSVFDQFALLATDADTTAPVTVYVQDRKRNWVLRNGIAVAPEPGPDGQLSDMFLQGFVILVKKLQAQA